jgi:cysteine desulfurase
MRKIYLDHAATTPILPEVIEEMLPYLTQNFGNPSSLHDLGQISKKATEAARFKVAQLINAQAGEIFFTSCGTEANNFALKAVAFSNKYKDRHIITSSIEHHSVINSAKALEKLGFEVTYLPVDRFGLVNPQAVKEAIKEETILISIMHANNEVGTIEPIAEIGKIIKECNEGAKSGDKNRIYFHTDAVSTAGTIPVDVDELGVDLLSMAAHQFYGPKGIGALYIRKGTRIIPFLHGGIQEDGKRAGTENVPGIVGFGKAAEIAQGNISSWNSQIRTLRDRLIEGLKKNIDHVYLNGHPTRRLPGNVNISVEFVEGESMLLFLNMEGIAASSGSSCTSHALKASHVLLAMGVNPALAQGSLLFSIGKDNTGEEIDYLLEKLPPIVDRLRQMSPLYPVRKKVQPRGKLSNGVYMGGKDGRDKQR